MAFCTHCGKPVGERDSFCGGCGARQAGGAGAPGMGSGGAQAPFAAVDSIQPQTAAMLCYAPWVGWIMAIIVLSSERFRQDARIRFHAFQGLYLWVAYLIVEWVVKPMFWLGHWGGPNPVKLLLLAIVGTSIYMLIKTKQGETIRLPLIGDLAEKSVAEQG